MSNKRVLIVGYCEFLTPDFIHFLNEKEFVNVVVCIASDNIIRTIELREPFFKEDGRKKMVESIKGVTGVHVVDGEGRDFISNSMKKIDFDILCLLEGGKRENIGDDSSNSIEITDLTDSSSKRSIWGYIDKKSRLTEIIASCLHDGWLFSKTTFGHRFGFERDRMKKIHCHLLPFLACGDMNRKKDMKSAEEVLKKLNEGVTDVEVLAEFIHCSSVRNIPLERRKSHPHVQTSWKDHNEEGRLEHISQAQMVLDVWENFKKYGFGAME